MSPVTLETESLSSGEAAPAPWLSLIGLGEDGPAGLCAQAKAALADAEIVFGGERHIALVGSVPGELRPWPQPFRNALPQILAQRGRKVCVLATSDPFHYGIGNSLSRAIPAAEMRIIPQSSSFSMACTRLRWPQEECALVSLHGRTLFRIVPHLQDAALRDALLITLEAAGHKATGADGGPSALSLLPRHDYNMVISDLRMDPMDGLQLLSEIRTVKPGLPVLLMTAFGDVDKAVAAMRGGACDFMLKPFEPKTLIEQIDRYAKAPATSDGVIAADPATHEVLLLASRVARTDATVMLTGESGTGKEVFAQYIHDQSPRASGPFVAINCAAIPDNLLEATLFGHEKGAFTGAQNAQAGKFEQANGGTLLLDEISEMPLGLQAKLLRVLQERVVDRVGGKKPVALDIRVLATSNRDMMAEVAAGRFREDLYYRLNVFPLQIPALRQRPADVLALARHFVGLHGGRLGLQAKLNASGEAKLAAHSWPGNVRELENVIQRALILAPAQVIGAEQISFSGMVSSATATPVAPAPVVVAVSVDEAGSVPEVLVAQDSAPSSGANMRDLERQHILETLARVGGSRKKAVEALGISERTLRYKLKQYREEGFFEE